MENFAKGGKLTTRSLGLYGMAIQRFCHGLCLVASLILATAETQSTIAETFSFRLKGFEASESSENQTLKGTMTIQTEEMWDAPQTLDFNLSHGDRGDQQFLDLAIQNQGESIFEAVLDIFGLDSRGDRGQFDANVSGDINATDSKVKVDLGENMPGMRVNIKTPQ